MFGLQAKLHGGTIRAVMLPSRLPAQTSTPTDVAQFVRQLLAPRKTGESARRPGRTPHIEEPEVPSSYLRVDDLDPPLSA
jgi:hypothetical protein